MKIFIFYSLLFTAFCCNGEEQKERNYEMCLIKAGEKIEREMVKKIEYYKKHPMKEGRIFRPKATREMMRKEAMILCASY